MIWSSLRFPALIPPRQSAFWKSGMTWPGIWERMESISLACFSHFAAVQEAKLLFKITKQQPTNCSQNCRTSQVIFPIQKTCPLLMYCRRSPAQYGCFPLRAIAIPGKSGEWAGQQRAGKDCKCASAEHASEADAGRIRQHLQRLSTTSSNQRSRSCLCTAPTRARRCCASQPKPL